MARGTRGFTAYSTLWVRVTVYDTNITNPNPNPKLIRHNQPLVCISPFVSYTVCFSHVVK